MNLQASVIIINTIAVCRMRYSQIYTEFLCFIDQPLVFMIIIFFFLKNPYYKFFWRRCILNRSGDYHTPTPRLYYFHSDEKKLSPKIVLIINSFSFFFF